MAAGKITELVDDTAVAQLEALIAKLGLARAEMASGIETALKYNAALGGATMANFTKANDDAVKSIERVKAANEDLATSQKAVAEKEAAIVQDTAKKLLDAEAKKQAAAEATLNKYLQLMSKQDAAMQAQMDKEIRAAQQKADRIAEIERRAANVRTPANGAYEVGSSAQLTREQAEALGAKARAQQLATLATAADIEAENRQATATQATTTATRQENEAITAQQQLLNTHVGTLNANISQQLKYQLELKGVQSQLKANSGDTTALKIREEELKAAISSQSLIIRQQVKDQQAAVGSQDQMLARLNLLRKAYNSLTDEERKNVEIGGVILRNIQALAAETTKINQEQGKYNDTVGKYEDAIKSAISSYVPYGNQILKSVDLLKAATSSTEEANVQVAGLGARFASFTIGAFAVGMASAVYYLQQFRDTGRQVDQFVGGLQAQFGNLGKNFIDLVKNGDKKKTGLLSGFVDSFNAGVDAKVVLQQLQDIIEVNDQLAAKKQANADQDRAKAKNQKLTDEERVALLKSAQKIEQEVIDLQKESADATIKAAIASQNAFKPLNPGQQKVLTDKGENGVATEGTIRFANDLAANGTLTEQAYELLMQGYQKETQALSAANMKLIRQQNDEAKIQVKGAKERNNDELELARERLTGAKETAQLILNDEQQSYSARLAALKIFVARSRDLIENENEIANRAPKITGTKIKANNQRAKNQNNQVDAFDLAERQKIQKEINESVTDDYKRRLAITVSGERALEDAIENGLNNQLVQTDLANSEKVLKLSQQYKKGELSEKDYQLKLKSIRQLAAKEQIDLQIEALEKIAAAQASSLALGVGDPKDLQATGNRITKLKIASNNLAADANSTGAQTDVNAEKEQAKETIAFAQQAIKGLEIAKSALQAQAEAEIALLERKAQLIDENATAEKLANDKSIASSKTKAANDLVIDARALQSKQLIAEQERKIKQRQAEYDKAISIAKIIEETAVAIVSALSIPIYGEALAIVIGALGAAQLAVVASTPLPQYEKGGTVSKDGHIITGEAGTELRINPDGSQELTKNKANVSFAKAGTKIINNTDLMRMLAKPEPINYVGGQAIDMKRLEKLMEENNELQRKQPKPNVRVTVNGDWNNYANKYFA